jgi:hypothetical protein
MKHAQRTEKYIRLIFNLCFAENKEWNKLLLPYLGLYNVHWYIMPLKISRKKLVRVYNAHGLLKKSPSEM